jgi:asparagine synthase (glutamine-hydrolysing)
LDLSPAGHQPMQDASQELEIIFNGEIYNYIELKKDLRKKGYYFFTESDTEVIPAAYDCWGIECLNKFDGMFALALWDTKKEQLLIARDRFGEKPLFYHADYLFRGKFEQFAFASEMKALWAAGVPRKIQDAQLLGYISLGLVQNVAKPDLTFFEDVYTLQPGHSLTLRLSDFEINIKKLK